MIYHADCIDILRTLPNGSIDMILQDPPYNTTACKWDSKIDLQVLWNEWRRVIRKGGAIVMTASQPFSSILVMSNLKMFKHEWIWHKSKSGSAFTARVRPMAKHESVLVFGNGKITYNPQMRIGEPYSRTRKTPPINNHKLGLGRNGESTTINNGTRYPDSVIFFQQKWRRQDQLHPTQKPVDLFRYLIRTYTNEGETVFDGYAGSGTTAVACIKERREYICCDKEEEYVEITKKQIDEAIRLYS